MTQLKWDRGSTSFIVDAMRNYKTTVVETFDFN